VSVDRGSTQRGETNSPTPRRMRFEPPLPETVSNDDL
jgi:hypothetical protein